MSPRLSPRQPRVRTAALAAFLAGVALSGCTTLYGNSDPPVVLTVTPTVTITPTPATTAAPSPSPSTSAADIKSDDEGKAYDLGKIVEVKDVQGTKVVTLDRFRNRSIPSVRLFAEGMQLEPHTREIFAEGSSQRYSIPVRPDATFTKLSCTSPDATAQSATSTLEELAGLQDRAGIVLLALDEKGWVKQATSDPVCL